MVMVYCEGPTEWYVIRKLNKHQVLAGQLIEPDRDIHIINSPSKITRELIANTPLSWTHFLLVYDREHFQNPEAFVNTQFAHLGPWNQRDSNIFCTQLSGKIVYLHVNDARSPNGYGDFDGYIWDLINNLGSSAANILFSLLPQYIKNVPTNPNNVIHQIHAVGSQQIPDLMANVGFPIQRTKGNIYAYITALQLAKSHVWFAEKLVDAALQQRYMREVLSAFSSLIQAWNWLRQNSCP